jgi:hypothetical protein
LHAENPQDAALVAAVKKLAGNIKRDIDRKID